MQHPDSTHYNLPNYIFMPLSMTRERVVSAVQKLIESFPELHTRFVANEQGEVRQWSDMSMPIPVVSRKCTEVELQAYIDKEFVRPFNPLGNEPLFRVEVVETEKSICLLSDGYHAIVDMQAFLDNLSDVYYKLSQNNFFPFASLVQEFNIAPIILFQFFPDWIMEDGKYDDLPRNETLVNKLLSTQKDFMVEALTDVVEMGNSYTFRIFYSGYYSRKMMKALAKTYKETIIGMLKSEV